MCLNLKLFTCEDVGWHVEMPIMMRRASSEMDFLGQLSPLELETTGAPETLSILLK